MNDLAPQKHRPVRSLRVAGSVTRAVALLAIGLWLSACGDTTPPAPVEVGAPVPDLALPTLDGSTLDLATLGGRTVVLNFWATWCQPCRREIPDLVALAEAGAVEVVGVALDLDGASTVRPFVEAEGISYPILLGDQEVFRRFQGHTIPYTVIVGPDGRVTELHRGALEPETVARLLSRPRAPGGSVAAARSAP